MGTHVGRLPARHVGLIPLVACLVLAGCQRSSPGASPAPSPARVAGSGTPAPSQVIARDIQTLRAQSYTVDYHTGARMPDGSILLIFHSLCTGSADGHCQAVDVFRGTAPRPLWRHEYAGVLSVHALGTGFTIEAVSYAPRDPLCCPSLPPVTDTYTWTGSGFSERGVIPNTPGG